MSSLKGNECLEENQEILGLYDPQTETFYKPQNLKITKKLWIYFKQEEKRAHEAQFAERLKSQKFDDFDEYVAEVKKRIIKDVALIEYDF